jgi:hypothetical protein
MGEERLLGSMCERLLTHSQEVCGQGGCDRRLVLYVHIGRNRLSISSALRVRATSVDLEVRIGVLTVQDAGSSAALRHVGVELRGVGILDDVRLSVGGCEIGLALLEVLNLAGGVLRAHKAAMQTSYLVTLSLLSARTRQDFGQEPFSQKWFASCGVGGVEGCLECATGSRRCECGGQRRVLWDSPWRAYRCPGTQQRPVECRDSRVVPCWIGSRDMLLYRERCIVSHVTLPAGAPRKLAGFAKMDD